jgi:hypothetical protein
MSLKIAISFVRIVIILMTFECITAAFVVAPGEDSSASLSVHSKQNSSSLLYSFVFEKAEEEERNEEENNRFLAVELADFSQIAFLLSEVHTPQIKTDHYQQVTDHQPELFKLFRVFII